MARESIWRFLLKASPFIGALAGSSFLLSSMTDTRYRLHRLKGNNDDVYIPSDPSDEPLYKSMVEAQDLSDWKNVRGPRPWEDSRTVQSEDVWAGIADFNDDIFSTECVKRRCDPIAPFPVPSETNFCISESLVFWVKHTNVRMLG